jgi:CTP synthase (UTP-ammonia lyase)
MAPLIGIVGDFNAANPTHRGTTDAFAALGFDAEWIATDAITESALNAFAGLVIGPGSPYRSMDGALAAIRHARMRGVPLIAT